jgi:hypothetical protein
MSTPNAVQVDFLNDELYPLFKKMYKARDIIQGCPTVIEKIRILFNVQTEQKMEFFIRNYYKKYRKEHHTQTTLVEKIAQVKPVAELIKENVQEQFADAIKENVKENVKEQVAEQLKEFSNFHLEATKHTYNQCITDLKEICEIKKGQGDLKNRLTKMQKVAYLFLENLADKNLINDKIDCELFTQTNNLKEIKYALSTLKLACDFQQELENSEINKMFREWETREKILYATTGTIVADRNMARLEDVKDIVNEDQVDFKDIEDFLSQPENQKQKEEIDKLTNELIEVIS